MPLGINIKASAKEIAARVLQTEPPVFLRMLDGIHIATAMGLGSPELITADKKMSDPATLRGIKTNLLKKITSE